MQSPKHSCVPMRAAPESSALQQSSSWECAHVVTCEPLGGRIQPIRSPDGAESSNFLAHNAVPTFSSTAIESSFKEDGDDGTGVASQKAQKVGLEAIVPDAFVLRHAFSKSACEDMIAACEELQFGSFNSGKNNHGAMQVIVTEEVANTLFRQLARHMEPMVLADKSFLNNVQQDNLSTMNENSSGNSEEWAISGINRRWRIYRYSPDGKEAFAPHIDAGFPASSVSKNGELIFDATPSGEDIVSRFTVLIYLNDDFSGGHTKFYTPIYESDTAEVIAAVKPEVGSILVFPQAIGEDQVEYARYYWPTHEGSPVTGGTRPKYVIRSDILYTKQVSTGAAEMQNDPLSQYDDLVRNAFLPSSSVYSSTFLSHLAPLYNPHMGVECAGPLLHSFIRFTKVRKIVGTCYAVYLSLLRFATTCDPYITSIVRCSFVNCKFHSWVHFLCYFLTIYLCRIILSPHQCLEIGAGYTSPWILQALKDNDEELNRIRELQRQGKCRLMDWPWSVPDVVENFDTTPASLLCIDNCEHQKETATGAAGVAKTLGLDNYLQFVKGDAFEMGFEPESCDLLWCDFGVGSRIKDFVSSSWESIRPGGFLVCHSTLTNQRTRDWLESARNRKGESETGIPDGEFVEISFLEPTKHYQNSISIFQRRPPGRYSEPLFSEYA